MCLLRTSERGNFFENFSGMESWVREMPFRHTSGVNIVKIVRGSKSILIPRGDEFIYPYDKLLAVGTSQQIRDFADMMEESIVRTDGEAKTGTIPAKGDENFTVDVFEVTEDSFVFVKALHDLSMRNSGCMIISVLRDSEIFTNPKADFRFKSGDTVWIAGEAASCKFFE